MSAEPKHVFDYTEWGTGAPKCRHPDHVAGHSATCWRAYANAAGWVSPEEYQMREVERQAQRTEKAEAEIARLTKVLEEARALAAAWDDGYQSGYYDDAEPELNDRNES